MQLSIDDYGIKAGTVKRLHNLKDLQRELQDIISYGALNQIANGFNQASPELLEQIRKVWDKWDREAETKI